jgi:hypothetical protein
MAGHGSRQQFNRISELAAQGDRDAQVAVRVLERDRANFTPNRPTRRITAKRITVEIVREVKRWFALGVDNQQDIATALGLGTSGRVTDILNGRYDYLLDGKASKRRSRRQPRRAS